MSICFKLDVEDCCRNKTVLPINIIEEPTNITTDSEDSDFEEKELDALENINISSIPLLPSIFYIDDILKSVISEHPLTDQQKKLNVPP